MGIRAPGQWAAVSRFARAALLAMFIAVGAVLQSVSAAVDGGMSRTGGRPGDTVTFRTDDHGSASVYASLESGPPIPLFMIAANQWGTIKCGEAGSYPLGYLAWTHGVGTLTFSLPNAQPGRYNLALETQGACWRIGSDAGPVTLDLMENEPSGHPAAVVLGLGAVGLLVAIGFALPATRRRLLSRRVSLPEHRSGPH